ncbi:MAG: DNA repair protein RadA [Chloroflexi bacterium]|nr:DNA repair protein RadA [Chloroflexota bacterium]
MAKGQAKLVYVCQKCEFESLKWMGKCPECTAYNSFTEVVKAPQRAGSPRPSANGTSTGATAQGGNRPKSITKIETENFKRLTVPIGEFDRVMGGGIVPGSLTLISGDPGIGKSTLLLQVTAAMAETLGIVLYVSAEESVNQIKLRAERLGLAPERLYLLSETNLNLILEHIQQLRPSLVVIDSIQTVYLAHKERNPGDEELSYGFSTSGWDEGLGPEMTAAAGSITQVRECAATLMRLAKKQGVPIFIVGHVTKEGNIAGPRVLEHMVDAVLYLEGDRFHQYRLLRGVKNRFGSTNEVGVFEMRGEGMVEVSNPSQAFLAERIDGAPGSGIAVTMEGTRPILVEVQALCSQCYTGVPRRTANGVDMNRLLLLTAVLSKRLGLPLGNQDVYVNVVGGLKIGEPAADLSVAIAMVSSFYEAEIDPKTVLIGEIGLSGEIRMVSQLERRLAEAAKLGFSRAVYPKSATANGRPLSLPPGFTAQGAATLQEALEYALVKKEGTHRKALGRKGRSQGQTNPPHPSEPRPEVDEFGNDLEPRPEVDEFGNDLDPTNEEY